MNEFRVRSKVWLEYRGRAFLGDGRLRLLAAVERTGSINAAARDLGISYRKGWAQLQAMEEHAPFPLLERRSGGRGGGATLLTADARAMLESFKRLREQVNTAADQSFTETFLS